MDKNYLDPNSIKKAKEYDKFEVKLVFKSGCKDKIQDCIDPSKEFVCQYCQNIMRFEIDQWKIISKIFEQRRLLGFYTQQFGTMQCFNSEISDFDEIMKYYQNQYCERPFCYDHFQLRLNG